jgi:purine-nucleoside phosphorylase
MTDTAEKNAALIRARSPLVPSVGIVLGSGLGSFTAAVGEAVAIPYGDLQGFPVPGVGTPVADPRAGQRRTGRGDGGRGHYYEHGTADAMRVALETLKALGIERDPHQCRGHLREDFPPGAVMLITDHINSPAPTR